MILEELEGMLITAAGDTVVWQGKKYTVAGRANNGTLWAVGSAQNPDVLASEGPILLCLDEQENRFFIPEREINILSTNPRYVIERILAYLDKKGAIDWDQLDFDDGHTVGDDK
jgi:hypothetical protein